MDQNALNNPLIEIRNNLDRVCAEIDKYTMIGPDGREMMIPLPSGQISRLTIAVETAIWCSCQQLASLYALTDGTVPLQECPMVQLRCTNEAICVYTTTLHRIRRPHMESAMVVGPIFDQFVAHRAEWPTGWEAVDVCIFNVYPPGTPENRMVDPDNICPKRVVDRILPRLNLDDNGYRVTLHVSAVISDAVVPGAYVLFASREAGAVAQDYLKTIENMFRGGG